MITPYSNIISVTTLSNLLLDTYSGAAAAYSLRKLSATYTGSAIRVRIDTTGQPEYNIGFVDNELDVATLEGYCTGGLNAYVITWYDQSGNANDATQGAAASQPQIVSSGSVILENNKPSVQFDGSNDSFNLSSNISSSTSYTAIEVNRRTDTSANSVGIANTGQPYVHLFLGTTLYFSTERSGNGFFVTYPLNSTNQQLLFSIDDKTNNLKTFVNQTLILNGLSFFGTTSSTSFDNIGNRSGFTKDNKQELIFYPSDQSSNRTGIETNINAQYQIYWDGSQTSLLDSYGGSAAAYSLRALSSAYVGPLVRVRRASDNAEQDIYANYDGTLNTSSLESFCSGTDGFVKTWYDQSGNANDATQTTASKQPQIVDSGSILTQNGKPTLRGNKTNNTGFALTSSINIDSFTILWVAKKTDQSSNGSIMLHVSVAVFIGDDINGAGNPTFEPIIKTANSNTSATGLEDTYHLSYLNRRNSNQAVGQFNGSNNAYNNSVSSAQYNISRIADYGSGYNYDGNYQEIIIYASDQSSNRTDIETNINDFYSIY